MTECTISVCISRQAEIPPAAQCTGSGHYGNAGCGVSLSGIQNPIDICLKVKGSKEFWYGTMTYIWANFTKFTFFRHDLYEKYQ